MYIISKLFTYIFLPPGIFIIILILAAFYAKRFKIVFFTFALIFYLLSISYISDALLWPLEKDFNKNLANFQNADAVIVLSGGSIAGSSNLPLGTDSLKRVTWGLFIAKSHNLPLIFSGGSLDTKYSESQAFLDSTKEFRDYLGIHIPISKEFSPNYFNVSIENKSLDTYQNAKFSKELFDKAGIKNPIIYLVTSAYHMKRAQIIFDYFGFKVIPAATDFKISTEAKTAWDILPNMHAFKNSYTALHEHFGILSLILRRIL